KESVLVLDQKGVPPPILVAMLWRAARGLKRFPDTLTGRSLQAAQLAVTAHAVNVAVHQERGRHDAVQAVGTIVVLALSFSLPDDRRLGLARVEAEHQRTVVKRGDEEQIARLARGGDAQARLDLEGLGPVHLARL